MRSTSGGLLLRFLLPLLLASTLLAEEDLYAVLGIDDSADSREIKSAYRKLSLKHHPDKGGDEAIFKKITAAYEVLSDGDKRALYEAGGMEAVQKGTGGRDPFGRPIGVQKGHDVSVTVDVPLEDMYKGGSVSAAINRRVVCRGCALDKQGGTGRSSSWWSGGSAAKEQPDRCAGCTASCPPEKKIVQRRMGPMIMNQEIMEPSKERCKDDAKTLHADIERGAAELSEVVFPRASEQTPGKIPGDVKLRLRSAPHAVFSRNGTNDLSMEMTLTLRQALLGFERTIRHLDGHSVLIRNEGVSTHGQVLTLPNEGMPVHGVPSEFGVLHVALKVAMPTALSDAEKDFVGTHFAQDLKDEPGAPGRK